ncbi:hypothetical protein L1049_008069 [Liquidambar formosana]|uniref:Uncharacterized protein n=1 Tax=Liquidambar formosana TaxID=63359 RepID=A0AAP0S2Z9_LIQFO
MGLPCAHRMRDWKDGMLSLDVIHSQWRIDTRSLTYIDKDVTNEEDEFKGLFYELEDKYKKWPLVQKENARETISQLVSVSQPLLFEPNVQPHKGHPLGSKKRKESSSTRRDPSKFEIVEKRRKCSICKGVGHNKSTCHGKTTANEQNFPSISNPIDGGSIMDRVSKNQSLGSIADG